MIAGTTPEPPNAGFLTLGPFTFGNIWTGRPPLLTPRSSLAAAAVVVSDEDPITGQRHDVGLLYAIGGRTSGVEILDSVEVVDTRTNTLFALLTLPGALWGHGAVGVQGRPRDVPSEVYVVGGHPSLSTSQVTARVDALNTETNRWRRCASMPVAGAEFGLAREGSRLHVVGGSSRETLHHVYDTATDAWATLRPLPEPRIGLGAAEAGGRIYAVGGRGELPNGNVGVTDSLFEYDPATDQWTERAPMPSPREGFAVVGLNGRVYVVGGRGGSPSDPEDRVYEYDPATDAWTLRPLLPTARRELAAAGLNGRLYAIGGRGRDALLETVEEYEAPFPMFFYVKN
jgi:hypothetical protein